MPKNYFNPSKPWREQINYGDDRVGGSLSHWPQPECRYRLLFSPVLRSVVSGTPRECNEEYQAFVDEHGPRLENYVDSIVLIKDLVLIIYFNGDYQDIAIYLKLNDLGWMISQIRFIEAVGDHPLDPKMISP